MNIGDKIRNLRNDKNLTQKELATAAGISEISIRKYENGDRKPKFETLQKIAGALNVSIHQINNTNSLTFKLIDLLTLELHENALDNIQNNTGIKKELINDIINHPYKDLSINDQQNLLKYLYKVNENTCKKFCDDYWCYGELELTELMLDIIKPTNLKIEPMIVSAQYIFDRDAFYNIIKTRILDISNHYGIDITEDEIKNIINQVDDIIYFELFKKHNKKPNFYDERQNESNK
ncbi:helix-turn-helix domain-containing protein [Haloimpatiens lingqiaonensis]|uniref:helix-turn-helix domain-containing protein n=1 Tax=Haloimpatiens lingqiaonensis TaxID=1380675 RepID=UPI0010FD90F8|nr:helix-turn-helix transcriptional regulator [Haloimpatiens lingqiaonensis]